MSSRSDKIETVVRDKSDFQLSHIELKKLDRSSDSLKNNDKYYFQDHIASGGMGDVHSARDKNINRNVAVKTLIDSEINDKTISRFIKEAQITGQLEHPNIVPVHDIGLDDNGNVFYSMKLIRGITLTDIIDKIQQKDAGFIEEYPLSRLISIFMSICDAVAYAHSKNVIHRDLKPDNIMVGEYGEVLVVDWGLAKILNEENNEPKVEDAGPIVLSLSDLLIEEDEDGFLTMDGFIMGTPKYMSPEQACGDNDNVDKLSDIYSLGIILYNILTLNTPIQTTEIMEVLRENIDGRYTPIRDWQSKSSVRADKQNALPHCPNFEIPDGITSVTEKCLEKEKEDRYQDILSLQADVRAWVNGFATSAEEASAFRQIKLLINRNRPVFILCAGALAIIIVIITIATNEVIQKGEFAQEQLAEKLELEDREKTRLAKIAQDADTEYRAGEEALGKNQLIEAQTAFRKALFLDPANKGSKKLLVEASLKHMELAIREQNWLQAKEKLMQAFTYGLDGTEYRRQGAIIKAAQTKRQNFLKAEVKRYMDDAQKLKRSIPEIIATQELIALKDTHTVTALLSFIDHENIWCRNLAMKSLSWMYEKGHPGRETLIKSALPLIEPIYNDKENSIDSQAAALVLLCQWVENDYAIYKAVDDRIFWERKDGRLLQSRIEFFFRKAAKAVNIQNTAKLSQASLLMRQNNHKEALELITEHLASNPDDFGAYINRAICYHDLKQYKNAIADCDKAISLNKKYVHPFINRANSKSRIGMYKEALADLQEALKINAEEQTALIEIAKTYMNLGDYKSSFQYFNKSISLDSKSHLAYLHRGQLFHNLGQYDKALADYSEVLSLYPRSVDAYMKRSSTYQVLKKYNLALEDLNKIPVINSYYKTYLNQRGLVYTDMNRYDLAIKDFAALEKIEPQNVDPVGNLGVIYYNQQDYPKAIYQFKKAIKLNPNIPTAHHNLGNAYSASNQLPLALASYKKGIDLDPDNDEPLMIVANIYNQMGNRPEAGKYYDLAILKSKNPKLGHHNARGNFFFFGNDFNSAVKDYSFTIKLDPGNYMHYMKRATCYQSLNEYALAVKDFDEAIKRHNKYPNLFYNRGLMKYSLKEYDGALKDMSQTLQVDGNFMSAYVAQANIYYDLKKYDKAFESIMVVVKNNPNGYLPFLALSKILVAQKKFPDAKVHLLDLQKGINSIPNKSDADKANLIEVEKLIKSLP